MDEITLVRNNDQGHFELYVDRDDNLQPIAVYADRVDALTNGIAGLESVQWINGKNQAFVYTTQPMATYQLAIQVGFQSTEDPDLLGDLPPAKKPPELTNEELVEFMRRLQIYLYIDYDDENNSEFWSLDKDVSGADLVDWLNDRFRGLGLAPRSRS